MWLQDGVRYRADEIQVSPLLPIYRTVANFCNFSKNTDLSSTISQQLQTRLLNTLWLQVVDIWAVKFWSAGPLVLIYRREFLTPWGYRYISSSRISQQLQILRP